MTSSTRSTFGRLGLLALAVIFVVAVSLANVILRGARLDLTQNKLYTLSPGTVKTLGSIPEPINLYFFFSDKATTDVPFLRAYAGRVRDMLREFAQYSNGKLKVTEVDPLPFTDDEDRATQFGLQGIRLDSTPDPVFFGIAGTNSTGDEQTLPFLDPSKESFLEYEMAKLVYALANPKHPVVGLMSGLPITAGFDAATQQVRQPWAVVNQMRQVFDVRQLEPTAMKIADDVQVLMVVHPKGLSDQTLYAIDQFILQGGRAMLFVDPWAETDPGGEDPTNPMAGMGMAGGRSSSLDKLFAAWGISVSGDKFVGDDRYALQVMGPDGRPSRDIGLIGIDPDGLDKDDVVTSGLTLLNFGFAGAVVQTPGAGQSPATLTPLVRSSDLSALVNTAPLAFMSDPSLLRENFNPSGDRYTLAARVSGKVPSAFPNGPPEGMPAGGKPHLAAAENPVNVVIVADSDFLSDRLWVQTQNFFGQRVANAFANNGDFVVNSLDNLLGSSDLIGIRGRATFTRPFTRVQELRRTAEDRFRVTEERLKQELQDTEQKLGELQARREDRNALIMSPEQEKELERFRDQRIGIRKELRQVQRNLDQDIERLGNWLKVINIGLMPLVIAVAGIVLLLLRRRRQAGELQPMNSRRLVMLFAALAVLVALAIAVSVSQRKAGEAGVLLPGLKAQLNDIDKIVVRTAGDKTIATLARQQDGWVLVERDSYPADVGRIRKDLIALAEAKILEEKTSNPELYGKLGVDDIAKETAGGVQLDIGAGDKVTSVIVGNTGVGGGERAYARRAGEPTSWLVSGNFELPREAAEWLDKGLTNIAAKRVHAVTIRHPAGPAVRLDKATGDVTDFTVLDVPKGRVLSFPGVGNAIGAALSDLNLETVEPASAFAPGNVKPVVTHFETFDGLIVEASTYALPSGVRVRFSASADEALAARFASKPAEPKPAEAKDGKAPDQAPPAPDTEKPKSFDEVKAEAAEINARLGNWIYSLPDFKGEQLTKKLDDLLEPLPAKAAPPKKPAPSLPALPQSPAPG